MQEPLRKLKADENAILHGTQINFANLRLAYSRPPISEAQERNGRALAVLNRVQDKLTGP